MKKLNMEEEFVKLNFKKWMSCFHSDFMEYNPTFIEIKDGKLIFGMRKHMGRLVVSVKKIISDLNKIGIGKTS